MDSASQPLYVLDEDRRIVFGNAAFRRWLGAVAEELPGRRCVYHSAPEAVGAEHLASALCPPPEAFSGKRCAGLIGRRDDQGHWRRRRAVFQPLGDAAELIGVVAIVDDLDLPEDADVSFGPSEEGAPECQRLHEVLQQLRHEQASEHSLERLVGTSSVIRRARSQAAVAASTRTTVTIVGPPGSGKERLARSIHFGNEPGQAGTIVPLDCEVLGGDLVRSTAIALAAQDSASERPGRNTLLLNRADTIHADGQVELARILLERPFPLRVMATTTRRLVELAGRGEYNKRLAMGLGTLEIELAPLSDRMEDLPLLTQMFVEEINAEGGKQIGGASPEALDMLSDYRWPGNIDELASVIAAAHRRAEGPEIRPADIPERVRMALEAAARPRRREISIQLDEYLGRIERELIERALILSKGNKTKAASMLGMNRPRLYRRLVQLGLVDEETDRSEGD
ncbi:MAG: AAA-type ATPase lid domain-containing protein [Thermoguttaceae bacterium]